MPEPIPLTAQITAVRREIAMRERVYPRQVARKRMTQADADGELAAMRAVLATLEGLRDRPPEATSAEVAAIAARLLSDPATAPDVRRVCTSVLTQREGEPG